MRSVDCACAPPCVRVVRRATPRRPPVPGFDADGPVAAGSAIAAARGLGAGAAPGGLGVAALDECPAGMRGCKVGGAASASCIHQRVMWVGERSLTAAT